MLVWRRAPVDPEREGSGGTETEATDRDRRKRIRCPRCGFEPRATDLWQCACAHAWNTFETTGLCPACGKQWNDTQCLRCGEWSRHRDWYVTEE